MFIGIYPQIDPQIDPQMTLRNVYPHGMVPCSVPVNRHFRTPVLQLVDHRFTVRTTSCADLPLVDP